MPNPCLLKGSSSSLATITGTATAITAAAATATTSATIVALRTRPLLLQLIAESLLGNLDG